MATSIPIETQIWSMKKLLIVSLLSVVTGMFVLNSVVNGYQLRKLQNKELAISGKLIASNAANQFIFALVTGISDNANEPINGLMNYPDVIYTGVYTANGVELASKGTLPEEERVGTNFSSMDNVDHATIIKENDNFVHIVTNVTDKVTQRYSSNNGFDPKSAKILGYVYLVMSKYRNQEQAESLIAINATTTLITTSILAALLLMISRYLVEPIRNIVNALRQVESGRKDIRMNITGPLETRLIGRALNNILEVIGNREEQLRAQNKILHEEITKREKIENERRKLEKSLQQARKHEAIGQLAGGIAHDFNNILATIVGFSSLTKQIAERDRNDKIVDYETEVLGAAERARALIKNMLSFSRSKQSHTRATIDIAVIVDEALRMLRSTIPTSIEIKKGVPTKSMLAFADDVHVYQIVLNLCINARDAIRERGVIEVKVIEQQEENATCIVCGRSIRGRFINISVKDNGSGIESGDFEKIFEPYFTRKEKGKGTGMGLTTVSELTHQMDGHITFTSAINVGSEFVIYLPVTAPTVNNSFTIDSKRKKRIMVIDDEVTTTNILYQFLTAEGYVPTIYNDSRAAYEELKGALDEFDLVITDDFMRGMSGSEIAMELSNIEAQCPFIIFSGRQTARSNENMRQPVNSLIRYIEKPLDFTALRQFIEATITKPITTQSVN